MDYNSISNTRFLDLFRISNTRFLELFRISNKCFLAYSLSRIFASSHIRFLAYSLLHIFAFSHTGILGFSNTWFLEYSVSWILGFLNTRFLEYSVSWLLKLFGTSNTWSLAIYHPLKLINCSVSRSSISRTSDFPLDINNDIEYSFEYSYLNFFTRKYLTSKRCVTEYFKSCYLLAIVYLMKSVLLLHLLNDFLNITLPFQTFPLILFTEDFTARYIDSRQ